MKCKGVPVIKHAAMKAYRGSAGKLDAFLT